MTNVAQGVVTQISIAVEIDGKTYYVALSQQKLLSLVPFACALSDSGKLPVVPAPEGTTFFQLSSKKDEECHGKG